MNHKKELLRSLWVNPKSSSARLLPAASPRLQYPLIKEYTLNHVRDLTII